METETLAPVTAKDVVTQTEPVTRGDVEGKWSRFTNAYNTFTKHVKKGSFVGFREIFKSKSPAKRIIWILFILCALAGCFYTVGDSVRKYINGPTATTIRVESKHTEGLQFPAVTFCPLNTAVVNRTGRQEGRNLAQLIEYLFHPDYIFEFIPMATLSSVLQACDEVVSNLSTLEAHTIWDVYLQSQLAGNFIYYCSFNQDTETDSIRCEDEIQPVLTSFGICYTFNHIHNGKPHRSLRIRTVGARHGLRLILNVPQDDYVANDGTIGVKVIVHERDDIARPNLYGIGVPRGKNAYISIHKRVDIDHTLHKCVDEDSLSFYSDYRYSQFACRQNALVEHVAQNSTCGCVIEPYRPSSGLYVSTPNCTFGDSCCILNATYHFNAYDLDCKLPCNFAYYDTHVSYSSFPTGPFLREFELSLNKSPGSISGSDLLSVNVYLEDLIVTTTDTEYSYTWSDLLGNFGGYLSLFLGIGILAALEMIVLLMELLIVICCPQKVKEIDQKVSLHMSLSNPISLRSIRSADTSI